MPRYLFATLLLVLFLGVPCEAKVYLVLWPELSLSELLVVELEGSLALMNTRVGRGDREVAGYLTLGAGARAYAPVKPERFVTEGEGGEKYLFHTGLPPWSIVNPAIFVLQGEANKAKYPLELGFLGETIHFLGGFCAVFGNSDTTSPFAFAPFVAMDSKGRVQEGVIDARVLLSNPSYPYGVQTDYGFLVQEAKKSRASLVVIEFGDAYRLAKLRPYLSETRYDELKKSIHHDIKEALHALSFAMQEEEELLIASVVSDSFLAPFFYRGDQALLTSATTKWTGVISNIDLAPFILSLLELPSRGALGRPIEQGEIVASRDDLFAYVKTLQKGIVSRNQNRSLVLKTVVTLKVISYLVALLFLVLPRRFSLCSLRFLISFLLLLLAVPVSLLLFPTSLIFVALLLFSLLLFGLFHPVKAIMGLALFSSLLLLLDVLQGASLIRTSFLGYDPIGGARYYGLGNEYMGIVVGASLMGLMLLEHYGRLSPRLLCLSFLVVLVVIGHPQLGTNVGGFLTAFLGFSVTFLLVLGKKIGVKELFSVGLFLLLGLGLMMLWDSFQAQANQSHIGLTVEAIKKEGLSALFDIIYRKLEMNYKLLRYSVWTWGLLVALFVMGISPYWLFSWYSSWKNTYPSIVYGLVGTLCASLTALVVNDSGVVAAATCIFFGSTTLLVLALCLKHDLLPTQTHIEHEPDSNEACEHGASPVGDKGEG